METTFKKYLKIIQESKNETINESSELSSLVKLLNELSPFKKYGNKLNIAKTAEERTEVIKDAMNDNAIPPEKKKETLDQVFEIDEIKRDLLNLQPDTFSGVMDKLKRMFKEPFSSYEPKKIKMDVNLP
jgi:hypothetical protein